MDYNKHIHEQNRIIKRWIPKVRSALKTSARWFIDGKDSPMVIRSVGQIETKLAQTIRSRTGQEYGAIELVSFNFERHGVFVHKGVGRGYEMQGGKVVRTAKGEMKKPRYAVEWFNPVLDKYVPELADAIALQQTNAVVNATKMRIN